LVIKVEYDGAMRKLGLSLLMVIALAVSGVANAMSAADCPMASAQVGSAQMGASALDGQHDCCPDRAPAGPGDEAPAKMPGCFVGQACRTATALAPDAGPLPAIAPGLGAKLVFELDPVFGSRSPDAFWRPPRTV
jgi:hypothetical protein